jgi:hypothetical protein
VDIDDARRRVAGEVALEEGKLGLPTDERGGVALSESRAEGVSHASGLFRLNELLV